MTVRLLVKGGIDNLYVWPYDRLSDVRYLLWPFINQKDHQVHIRMIYSNCSGDLL